jgi:hypothetical protein
MPATELPLSEKMAYQLVSLVLSARHTMALLEGMMRYCPEAREMLEGNEWPGKGYSATPQGGPAK